MSTKKELVREYSEIGLTHDQAEGYLEDVLAEIKDRLSNGEEVQVTNFGRFELRQHDGRTMKNPKTGEEHDIPDRFVVHFRPSEHFKDRFSDE